MLTFNGKAAFQMILISTVGQRKKSENYRIAPCAGTAGKDNPERASLPFTLTLAATLVLSALVLPPKALSTRLNTQPLPHEREVKDFEGGEQFTPPTSRFHRRPDYREEEAKKKEAAEQEKKQAAENVSRAQSEQAQSSKKRSDDSVAANNKGVALGMQHRFAEAIAAHESAVQLDPQNKQFRINLSAARTAFGQERLAAGDFSSAANLFRKALAAASDNGLAGKMLAETMKRQGRDPNNCDIRLATGDQLAAVGDFEGATIEYQAAMQLEPSARTYLKVGDMALRYGQITTASNWYRQSIVKDPDYGPAHRQLGFLALAQKDFTSAAASLRKAVILDPKDTAAGQTLVEIWRYQVAGNPLLAENHLGLAGALQLTGDFVGADGEYRKLEALDPKNPGLESGRSSLARAIQHARAEKHKLAADTLFNQGLRREALAEISQAVMMEPKNARYQFLLAECLEASGDYQGAHQAYLTCVLMDPENNREAAQRLKEMQNNLRSQGMNVAAMNGQQASQIAGQFTNQQFNQGQFTQEQPQFMRNVPPPAFVINSTANVAPEVVEPTFKKNMFEGGHGMSSAASTPENTLRTHDESAASIEKPVQIASGQPLPGTAQSTTRAAGNINDRLSQVTDAETQKNYACAIDNLRQLLAADLQNAELHHRLAINLLAEGQISEAIAEFRIAAALAPAKSDYAGDLARAMAIHKRSLQAESSTLSPAGSGIASSKEVTK